MKTSTILFFLFFTSIAGLSQSIEVTFTGKSSLVNIDSVNATNLTTDETISLPGDATLLLSPKTGISDIHLNNDISLVYPNPFPGQSTIKAFTDEPGKINLKLMNLAGQLIAQTSVYLEFGEHSFMISLSKPGIYFATLETKAGTKTHKLMNIASSPSGNQILLFGSTQHLVPSTQHLAPSTQILKSSFSLGYSAGDIISYYCFSDDFNTEFTDSPMESINYEVAFPPIAAFNIDSGEGTTEDRITLDASVCIDAESSIDDLEVRWDLEGDSIWDTDFDQNKSFIYKIPLAGTYTIWLQVKDSDGMTDSVSIALDITYPSFTDSRDGNIYRYKRIGDQYWMVDNLAYLPSVIQSVHGSMTEPRYYVYGYEGAYVDTAKIKSNYLTYGTLYNWPAALEACPEGWHLPSDEEFTELEMYLGMTEEEANTFNAARKSGSVGGKLKEKGTDHWESPNTGATNSVGFTALPAGQRSYNGGFIVLGEVTCFWSSTDYVTTGEDAYYRAMANYDDGVFRYAIFYRYGLSVRCIKD